MNINQTYEYFSTSPWIILLILLLGAYSITRLIVTDTFPLFEKPRNWIFQNFPHDGYSSRIKPPRGNPRFISADYWVVDKGHWLGNLISCPWCAGWWVSLGVVISFLLIPEVTFVGLLPFALRAFVGGYANKIGGG